MANAKAKDDSMGHHVMWWVGTIAGLGLLTAIGLQVSWWIAVPAAIIGLGLVFGRD
jgi:hypothetical protein